MKRSGSWAIRARIVGGVAAVATAGAAVFLLVRAPVRPDSRPPLAALARALNGTPPYDVAIAGLPTEAGATPLSDGSRPPDLSPAVRAVAAAIEDAAGASEEPEAMAAAGVAQLLAWRLDEAVLTLERVVRARPTDAAALTNLAAACLVRGRASGRVSDVVQALDASERAVALSPDLQEAARNRDAAGQRIRLTPDASQHRQSVWDDERAAWTDPDRSRDRSQAQEAVRLGTQAVRELLEEHLLSAWGRARLARQDVAAEWLRRARLLSTELVAAGGDPLALDAVRAIERASDQPSVLGLLALGHRDFGDAQTLLSRDRWQEAGRLFEQSAARLRSGGSPFALAADEQVAAAAYGRDETSQLDGRLKELVAKARAGQYVALAGLTEWLRGLSLLHEARVSEALEAYAAAASAFRDVHEDENEASVSNLEADALGVLGEHAASWNALGRALDKLPLVRRPRRRFKILLNGAIFSVKAGLLHSALQFQNAALAQAVVDGAPTITIEAYVRRSQIHRWLNDQTAFLADLEAARAVQDLVTDPLLRRYYQVWLDAATGQAVVRDDPKTALTYLDRIRADTDKLEPDDRPFYWLAVGRARRALGDTVAARQAFLRGISDTERRRTALTEEHRVTYGDQSSDLYEELARLEVTDDAPDRAFAVLERTRARSLVRQETRLADPARLARQLPTGVAVLFYAIDGTRLYAWVLKRESWHFAQTPWDQQQIDAAIDQIRSSGAPASRGELESAVRLYDALVKPLAGWLAPGDTLVFVPDGRLALVPFAALVDPADHRFLIERHAVAVAPNTSMATTPRAVSPPGRAAAQRVLLVATPEASGHRLVLPRLPYAEQEVRAIAGVYPGATVLVGTDATRDKITAGARQSTVVHFAGHALANEDNPWMSRLILGTPPGSDEPDQLMAYEVRAADFGRVDLVVLAACRTADGDVYRSEGPISLARAFLAAGVPNVVASLADVDDRATGLLLRTFHEEYSRSNDPVSALRAAQLRMSRSNDRTSSSPGTWAMFTVLGRAVPDGRGAGEEHP